MLQRWWNWLLGSPSSVERARERFLHARETLQRRYFERAAASGRPRGLRWKQCQWGEQLELARERNSGQLVALAAVSIAFEAVPGSDMEELPAVGELREASAVFYLKGQQWDTAGKTLFNLLPSEALQRLAGQYEPVR